MAERFALVAALLLLAAAAVWPRRRAALALAAAAVLMGALAALGAHHLLHHDSFRLVWLYGMPEAAWYVRLSTIWAGDEGTLLLLAALTAALAPALARRGPWTGLGALAVAAFFTLGALVWDPFQPVAADAGPARGGSVHLDTVWMAVHPPLVLVGYALLLALVGAALAALAGRDEGWGEVATRFVRPAWLLLGLGLVTGMWWAYEDFTFAPFWHWDPVQSAVFAVWALTTAHLHTLSRYKAGNGFGVVHPLLGVCTGLAVLVAMAVTRHPALASSHRYVGDTSLPLLLTGAATLLLVGGAALYGRHRAPTGGAPTPLKLAVAGLAACGVVVLGHLAWASAAAALDLPRPAGDKPYYELLARWASADETAALERVFDQWEPDPVAVNDWLLPPAVGLALLAGHMLLPLAKRPRRAVSLAVAAAAAVAAVLGGPGQRLYSGTGMTASGTVAALPWIDALAVALLYAAGAGAARAGTAVVQSRGRIQALGVGAAHFGVAIGLLAFLAATVLDSYGQTVLRWPEDFGRPIVLRGGPGVELALPAGAQSVAVSLIGAEGSGRRGGTAGYREAASSAGDRGPVRVMCEMLDYRYARFAGTGGQMIAPYIHRGLWRDVQVWVGGIDRRDGKAPRRVPLVVKVLPMAAWVWLGFGTALAGGAAVLVAGRQGRGGAA